MTTKKHTTDALVIERTFNAPPAKVWKALTTIDAMKHWFFELKEFKPEVGFEYKFTVEHEGFIYNHQCRIVEVVPQKKLVHTWRYEEYEGDSTVTWELFAEGDKTHLKLTHEGLESFPKSAAFARTNFEAGWTHISSGLKDFVESDTADREIVISRVVNAPRELVWEAISNPKHIVHWWGPNGFSTTIEKMDFRVGGEWKHIMHGPDGANYPNHHVFHEIVKPERIVSSHGGGREGGQSVSSSKTWTFEEVEKGKTKITIRMVFASPQERERVAKEFGAVEGGMQTVARLAEYLPQMPATAVTVSKP